MMVLVYRHGSSVELCYGMVIIIERVDGKLMRNVKLTRGELLWLNVSGKVRLDEREPLLDAALDISTTFAHIALDYVSLVGI